MQLFLLWLCVGGEKLPWIGNSIYLYYQYWAIGRDGKGESSESRPRDP